MIFGPTTSEVTISCLYLNSWSASTNTSGNAYLDWTFNTGAVSHKVTVGGSAEDYQSWQGAGGDDTTYLAPLYNVSTGPVYTPPPSPALGPEPDDAAYYDVSSPTSHIQFRNFIFGDDVKFSDHWGALIAANDAYIENATYSSTPPFGQTTAVEEARLTPSLSLVYKPSPAIMMYATYNQAVEEGAEVPNFSIYTNAGQILPPYVADGLELGAKANVGGTLLTAALFQVNEANQYAQVNSNSPLSETYLQDGLEINKGFELTATGNLVPGLRLLGGVTVMNNTVVQTGSAATNNQRPAEGANDYAKATLEYELPPSRRLTLTGGIYYTGNQAGNTPNTLWLPP